MSKNLISLVDKEQGDFEARKAALKLLEDTCVKNKVCAACGAAAGLYLAAQAATKLDHTRDSFQKLAGDIWDDVTKQLRQDALRHN